MPYGARTSLAALILSAVLGAPAAWAEPAAGSTWTDPPARKAAPVTSRAEAPAPAPPAASTSAASTPAAAAPAAARKAVAARPVRQHIATRRAAPAPKRIAATAPRARVATAPARIARPHRMVAIAPPPPPGGYRSYGYGLGYGTGYSDDRLERLRAAEAAGYMVVHRRTVDYPDGRSLRVYRPDDEGEPY